MGADFEEYAEQLEFFFVANEGRKLDNSLGYYVTFVK